MAKGKIGGGWICGAVCLSCCVIIFVLGLIAMGIAEIVIGAIYIHDCSLQKMVPIYLIVSACAPILFSGQGNRSDEDNGTIVGSICGIVGALFNLAWLICGTVWIYPTYAKINKDTYVPCKDVNGTLTPPGCTEGTCNDTLLKFSFAMVTLHWICVAMWIGLIVCTVARCRCMLKYEQHERQEIQITNGQISSSRYAYSENLTYI